MGTQGSSAVFVVLAVVFARRLLFIGVDGLAGIHDCGERLLFLRVVLVKFGVHFGHLSVATAALLHLVLSLQNVTEFAGAAMHTASAARSPDPGMALHALEPGLGLYSRIL